MNLALFAGAAAKLGFAQAVLLAGLARLGLAGRAFSFIASH